MNRVLLASALALASLLVACTSEPERSEPGTFETLIGWVSQDAAALTGWETTPPLFLGDIAAWRELTGVAAPDGIAGEDEDFQAVLGAAAEYGVSPWSVSGYRGGWFIGGRYQQMPQGGPRISERTSAALGFGARDVTAFAQPVSDEPFTVMAGSFDATSVASALDRCEECEAVAVEVINGATVFSWDPAPDVSRSMGLPFFDQEGRGGSLAVFPDRIVRTADLPTMRRALEGATLGDVEAYRSAARIADDLGLFHADFTPREGLCCGPSEFLGARWTDGEALPGIDRWDLIAGGGGYEDGAPFSAFILGFADEATATANVEPMRERIEAIPPETLFRTETGMRAWRDVSKTEVEPRGRHLVVTWHGFAVPALGGLDLRPLFGRPSGE